VAPQTAVLGVRGLLDGSETGTNQENQTPALGTFDATTRTFVLDFQGQDVDEGTARTVSVHLVGQIDNGPPTAVITGAPTTLECGTPASLSGQSSSDPDVGDSITRFQWTVNGTAGGSADHIDVVSHRLGRNDYDLRVYDRSMAAGHASVSINLVDTKAPQFTFVPPNITVRTCAGVNIGTATATDACGPVTVTSNAPAQFTVGQTTVTWTARDGAGNTRTATQIVTVELGDDASCCPAGSHVIVGTSNNDVLTGTAGVDCILGKGGQDQISGRGGNDFISGGDGNDVIFGEDGNDVIFGGSGQDEITGGNGNDTINGGDGDDVCRGSGGNDVIHGNQGQDRLFGEDAADFLFGDDGDDTLDGGPGNDALNGGGIHDTCVGGTGTNTFTLCETRR
jgi:Ca2+-binding RTX toxin-like protein